MSVYYSKWLLNTYRTMPYFRACLPEGYPLDRVLRKCRAFRKLPRHLRELAAKSKAWAMRKHPQFPAGIQDIERWYDSAGYELNPATGAKLTEAENDALWQPEPELDDFVVEDIEVPAEGFPDPDRWEPSPEPTESTEEEERPTPEQLQKEVQSRGTAAVAAEYGISEDSLKSLEGNQHVPAK